MSILLQQIPGGRKGWLVRDTRRVSGSEVLSEAHRKDAQAPHLEFPRWGQGSCVQVNRFPHALPRGVESVPFGHNYQNFKILHPLT